MRWPHSARRAALLVLSATSLAGCTPSLWSSRKAVDAGGTRARLLVPRLYAPLLFGSVYPDKRREVPARGRSAVLLAGVPGDLRSAGPLALAPLGERGLVVLRLPLDPAGDGREIASAAGWLSAREECRGTRSGLLLLRPGAELLARLALEAWDGPVAVAAAALPPDTPREARLSGPVLWLALADEGGAPVGARDELRRFFGRVPAERWYRARTGDEVLPALAYRDAAEWLAEVLSSGAERYRP